MNLPEKLEPKVIHYGGGFTDTVIELTRAEEKVNEVIDYLQEIAEKTKNP